MNQIHYFEIQSENPEKLVDFYKQIFSWEYEKDESLPIEYFRLKTPTISGAVLRRPSVGSGKMQGTNAFTCSIEIENFDDIAKKIQELGGQIAMEKFAIPGKCWQGYFLDPDENVFGIFEADESAK